MGSRPTRGLAVAAAMLALSTTAAAQSSFPATLGASTPELQDDVSETGLWGLPDAHGSTTDTDGAIEMTFDSDGWMWGWRDLAAAHHPVVRVQGSVAIDGDDVSGGWMCGATDSLFAFGVVDAEGDWRIGHIIEGEVTVDLEGAAQGGFEQGAIVSVECGEESVDVTRLLLRIDGVSVGTADVGPLGPFDRVALVGSSESGEGSIRFDDIAAWTGAEYEPTDAPPSTPGPAPTTPLVAGVLGADTLAFEDDFSTPGQWGTGSAAEGFVSYDAEQLAITIISDSASRWSWRSVDAPASVLRIDGSVGISGEGSAGWMCGDASADPSFLFAVTSSAGSWMVGEVVGSTITVIDRGEVAGGAPEPRVSRHVVLECGDTVGDASRVVLWVDGEQVADLTADGRRGPFSKVAAIAASASDDPLNARFDDVSAWTGEGPAPEAS
ncbi:MAG: hypothetical protein ABWZ82_10100 [Candidatus Limnocylindrales bacterium]